MSTEFDKDQAREMFRKNHPTHRTFTSHPPIKRRPYATVWTKGKIVKVAREYGDKTAQQLSLEIGIAPAYINTMVSRLRKDGVTIQKKPRINTYKAALEELKPKDV